jgi:hypothetical protein
VKQEKIPSNSLPASPISVDSPYLSSLADFTDSSSRGFFLADFKGKNSGDLLFHISWNRSPLLLPEYSKGEEVMLAD